MNQHITIGYDVFLLADKYAAQDASRPALYTVNVNARQHRLEAADGFVLGTMPFYLGEEDSIDHSILIPVPALKKVQKLTDKGESVHVWEVDGKWHLGKPEDYSIVFKPVDAIFANVDEIMDRAKDHKDRFAIGPKYLKRLAETAIAEGSPVVWFQSNGPTSGIRFAIGADNESKLISGMVMPVVTRGDITPFD
jgi:DNA polymerase III sliding clamp (beta) subunit (PCNA family)